MKYGSKYFLSYKRVGKENFKTFLRISFLYSDLSLSANFEVDLKILGLLKKKKD